MRGRTVISCAPFPGRSNAIDSLLAPCGISNRTTLGLHTSPGLARVAQRITSTRPVAAIRVSLWLTNRSNSSGCSPGVSTFTVGRPSTRISSSSTL